MSSDVERGSPRVLAADDNEVNRKILSWQLDKLGVDVDLVASGAEAVAAVARGGYALVFMDVKMADMNGYAATRAIRSQEQGSRVPIVAITANADVEEQDRCRDAGMDDFMPKPIQLPTLAALLVRWGVHGPASAPASGEQPVLGEVAPARLAALERAAGRAGLAAQLVDEFVAFASARIRRMDTALGRSEDDKLARECFALRLHSRGVGAHRLEHAIARLAEPGDMATRTAHLAAARTELAAVIAALRG